MPPTSPATSSRPVRRATAAFAGASLLVLTGLTSSGLPTTAEAAPTAPPAPAAPAAQPAAASTAKATVSTPAALDAAPFDVKRQLRLPSGWRVSVWARATNARLLVWTPDGRMLVSRPKEGVVTRLTPNKRGYPSSSTLLKGLRQPHGLAFSGNTLYVAESNRVDSYTYKNGKATNRRTVLGGLPDSKSPDLGGAYAHALKSLAVGRDGALYVSIGSSRNVSPGDRSANPQRATILRVKGGKTTVYARGVRNGTGLAVAQDGALWTAVNNRDNTAYPYNRDYTGDGTSDKGKVITRYVNDHPLEPLAKLTPGRDLGWPYCNPDPDVTAGASSTKFAYANRRFIRDVQTNNDGSKLDCSALAPVEQGLGAHSAPLGLSFTRTGLPKYGQGALVGVHGSWNRKPPRAPEVAFFASRNGGLGGRQTLVSGFQSSSGSRWGRPVMALQGPDKAIYVSDDYAGAIYRIMPRG